MKFGVAMPTAMEGLINPVPFFAPSDFVRIARRAEELGYDSVWGNDHYAPQRYVTELHNATPNFYDVLTVLAAVSAVTRRVELGTAVLVLPIHDPVAIARQTAALDLLSGGRLLLGVGIGAYPEEFAAARPELVGKHRGRMMEESLALIRRLHSEPVVSHRGRYYRVDELALAPKPTGGRVRIFVGGHQMRGIERAVEFGDGWIPGWRPFDELEQRIAKLRTYAAQRGLAPSDVIAAPQFSCLVDADHEKTLQRYRCSGMVHHRQSLNRDGRDPAKSVENNLIGSYDHVLGQVERLHGMGADHLASTTFCVESVAEYEEQLDAFAERIIAPYRAAHGIEAPV